MAIDIINEREEWITEWMNQVNNESDYPETGEDWGVDFNGNFIFEVEPDAEYEKALENAEDADEIRNGTAFFTEVEDGEVHSATNIPVEDKDEYEYGFTYRGPYENWKGLINQEIGAIDGMMSGKFELDGDMQKVLQWSDGASSLANGAGLVDTTFPEE